MVGRIACFLTCGYTEAKDYIQKLPNGNANYIKQINESRRLYYSKKLHGDRMLRNIQPELIARICRRYFGTVFNDIRSF